MYRGSVGPTSVIAAVDDADALAAAVTTRCITPDVATEPSGTFRIATVQDPAGNTIMFSQTLHPQT